MATTTRFVSLSHRELDFSYFVFQEEALYKIWFSIQRYKWWLQSLPDSTKWNSIIAVTSLLVVILSSLDILFKYDTAFELSYNVMYAVHVGALWYLDRYNNVPHTCSFYLAYILDVVSYLHYFVYFVDIDAFIVKDIRTLCYYLRLHRPLRFLWDLNEKNPKRTVVSTVLKYTYVCWWLRVTFAILWEQLLKSEGTLEKSIRDSMSNVKREMNQNEQDIEYNTFFWSIYVINKMFVPIGPQIYPTTDMQRVLCMIVMIIGTLTVAGVTVATMAIVLSVYMKHEEVYRARFKLIMKDMEETRVPRQLMRKVVTFYRMYWHKQRGTSYSELLRIFPPTLSSFISSDIYFEAQQSSRVLRDLSIQFLSEVALVMTTTNFIPGDAIIKRNSTKSSIVYITYGDVEMLTAEDDMTPILRFSRGTMLNGCGVCPQVGCARAHVEIRAATFCTAHVLRTSDFWKVIDKFGKESVQSFITRAAFEEHFECVKRHYNSRIHPEVRYKSSIVGFKRNLIDLKEARFPDGQLLLQRDDVFLEIAGCYIMRNRADSSLTEEADEICLRPTFPCILQSTSSLQWAWSLFVALIIFIVSLVHPYCIVHTNVSPLFRFFDYVTTLIFGLDILRHLSTGAKIEEGVPITFRQTSSEQMKSFWFALDVLATLPIFEFVGEGNFAGINKLLKLPKLFKVLKSIEELSVYHNSSFRMLAYLLLILMTSYLVAMLQQGFMCFQFSYCEVTSLVTPPFWSKTPLTEDNDKRLPFGLYWAISMVHFITHKTSEWAMETWEHRLYTMGLLEGCILLSIFTEALYSAAIMVSLSMRQEYEALITDVKTLLIRNNVDPMLRHRFIEYLQLCWHTDKAYAITHKKQTILFDLPPHVSSELLAMQRSKYMLGIPFMRYIRAEHLTHIASQARLFYTSPNEILLNTGDISNEMYVIKQGFCEIINPDTRCVVSVISCKQYFGVMECLLRIPSFYTVRAVTHVQVFSISAKHLAKILEIPRIKDAIDYAKTQDEYTRLLEKREPFVTYKVIPPSASRCFFPLPRKYEADTAYLKPFHRLGFLSILRYVFPRFTITPDGRYMKRYEWFRAICAILSSVVFPCYTYMVLQFPALVYLHLFLDFSAYFDVIQRMLVCYYDERGILVYHPASTAAHYLKGAFTIDLLGVLPLELLDRGRARIKPLHNKFRLMDTVQHLMFNRLLQLYRLPSALNALSTYIEREDILLIIKGVPLFVALLNALASAIVYESVEIYAPPQGGSWVFFILPNNGSWLTRAKHVFRFDMRKSPMTIHLTAFFWVVYETTSTGYNIFNPSSKALTTICYVGIVVGTVLTTYYAVRVISIRANVNTALATFQEHMQDIISYMRKERLEWMLEKEMIEHYSYTWEKMGGTDYLSILKLCDQITLRTDAILHIYGKTFSKCPIMLQCDVSLLRVIGRALHSDYFLGDTHLIDQDDVIAEMYFVDYGLVEVRAFNEKFTTVAILQRGSMFGNLDDVSEARCENSFVATTNVHLLKIKAEMFHRIIRDFPSVKELLHQYRPHEENYIKGTDIGHRHSNLTMRRLSMWRDRNELKRYLSQTQKGLTKYIGAYAQTTYIYLIVVSLLSYYLDVYNAFFQNNTKHLVPFLYFLDLAFCVKIVAFVMLPYIDCDQETKINLMKFRHTYFQGELKVDVMSCVPMEIFCLFAENKWRLFAFLRLNRVLRVVTISQCLKRHHEKLNVNLVLATLTSVTVWFTVFMHTMTCVWYYLGKNVPACQNYYLCALYFILTTFTQDGVGDILPKTEIEVVFVCVLQIISTMLKMIYVGEFSNIIQYRSFRSFAFYTMYVDLQEFLKSNYISRTIADMVNAYSLHLWRENRGVQIPYFLETAPQCLQTKVMNAAYQHHALNHPVFKNCEPAFLRQLVRHFKLFSYSKGLYVVRENVVTDAMYFIHRGKVEEVAEEIDQQTNILYPGQYVGTGLYRNTPYYYSYRTVSKSQVLTLCLNDWEYLLKHFPVSKTCIYKEIHPSDDDDKRIEKEERRVQMKDPTYIEKAMRFDKQGIDPALIETTSEVNTIIDMPSSSNVSDRHVEPAFSTKAEASSTKNVLKTLEQTEEKIDPLEFEKLWPMDFRQRYSMEQERILFEEQSKTLQSADKTEVNSEPDLRSKSVIIREPEITAEPEVARSDIIREPETTDEPEVDRSIIFREPETTEEPEVDRSIIFREPETTAEPEVSKSIIIREPESAGEIKVQITEEEATTFLGELSKEFRSYLKSAWEQSTAAYNSADEDTIVLKEVKVSAIEEVPIRIDNQEVKQEATVEEITSETDLASDKVKRDADKKQDDKS